MFSTCGTEKVFIVIAALLIGGLYSSCGQTADDSNEIAIGILDLSGDEAVAVAIENSALPNSVLSVGDIEDAGWKKSKQLDGDGLQGTTGVWYGFYTQKDIELWIYTTPADARRMGAPAAQAILDESRGVDVLNSIRGGTSVYSAYGIIGNVVLFCEETESCNTLAEQIKKGSDSP